MSASKKHLKLETLVEAQKMLEEEVDALYATLTEDSSEKELIVFGRRQMAILVLDKQIQKLRRELGVKHKKHTIYQK